MTQRGGTHHVAVGEPRRLPLSYWLLVSGSGGVFASIGMANFLIPQTAVHSYDAEVADVGILVASFLILSTLIRPLCAELADVVGHRRLLGLTTTIYVASLVAVPLVDALGPALVVRSVGGAAQGCVYLLILAAVVRVAPAERMGRALSLSSLVIFAGLACSPVLAELVRHLAGDLVAWMATALVVALTAPLSWWAMPEPAERPPNRAMRARLPWRLLVMPAALLALGSVAYGAFQTLIPLYAPTLSDQPVSLLFFVVSLSVVLTQAVTSVLIDRVAPMVLAGLSILLSSSCMALVAGYANFGGMVAGAAALGAATALLYPTVTAWVLSRLSSRTHIRALALLSPNFEVGQGSGAVVASRIAGQTNYGTAFASCAGLSATGVLLALVLHRRTPR